MSCVYMCGVASLCLTLCDPVDCGFPGFSAREGVLQARILDHIGQHWLPYLSRALYFLLPQPPTPLSTWCCQNPCDPSNCTTSTLGPHGAKPSPPGQPQKPNLSGRPPCRGGNKTTVETAGAVWLRKKTQNLPISCTSCKLNPHAQLGRLCVYGIYKRPLRAPRKHTSSDSCGHWRQEHTRVGPDQNLSCPHSRSRDQHSVRGHPREVRWTVTPSKGKDSDNSDTIKTFIILIF